MTTVIGIVNPRQKAGKTAMAANVAVGMALLEKKTLLVDGDPQGGAAAMLTGGLPQDQPGLASVLTGRANPESLIRPTGFAYLNDYLGVIPAGNDLLQAEHQFESRTGQEDVLRHAVQLLPEDIDYVVMDAPSSLGFLTTCIITASDFLVMPVPCRADSVASLGALLAVVRQVRKNLNPGLRIAGVVFTQCDNAADIQSQIPSDLLAGLKPVLLDITIGRSDESSEGVPVLAADVMSAAAEKYLDLTAILVEKKAKKAG